MNRLTLLIIMALLLMMQNSTAQVVGTPYIPYADIPFSFLYGGNDYDGNSGFGIIGSTPIISYPLGATSGSKTSDGGYIITGTSSSSANGNVTGTSHGASDYWVIKLDASGNIQWQRLYGGTDHDYAVSIMQTADGGYIIGGTSDSSASGDVTGINHGSSDYWVVKLNSTGTIQWQKLYGGNNAEMFYSIQQTADGGYILVGWTLFSSSGDVKGTDYGNNDYWVVKLNSAGTIQWQKRYGGNSNDYGTCIKQTKDGGYLVAGYSNSSASGNVTGTSHGSADYWILKLDASGNIEWQKLYGGSGNDMANSIELTTDGGYIIAGYSDSSASGNVTGTSHGDYDYWIIKLDTSGNIQWQKLYGGSGTESIDKPYSILQTSDGGYILGGKSKSSASGDVTETGHGDNDVWILKLDALGNIQWQKLYGGTGSDSMGTIMQNTDGSYTVAASSTSSANGDVTDTSNGTLHI